MPDDRDPAELRRALDQLHRQLDGADSVDPGLDAPLREALRDIQGVLGAQGQGDEHGPLSERISELALEFEREHPTIASTLNQLTMLLSNLGI